MLILEGSDCLGKTTFAKLLLKVADKKHYYPTYYSHMSRPNKEFDFFEHYKDMMSTYAIQDRFHLGGIVWHQAISQVKYGIIESWLKSIGSMNIIFFASDHKWYRKHIEEDKRGNMLSVDNMCAANREYEMMVTGTHSIDCMVDFKCDLKRCDENLPEFPNEEWAEHIVKQWFDRLHLLEKL